MTEDRWIENKCHMCSDKLYHGFTPEGFSLMGDHAYCLECHQKIAVLLAATNDARVRELERKYEEQGQHMLRLADEIRDVDAEGTPVYEDPLRQHMFDKLRVQNAQLRSRNENQKETIELQIKVEHKLRERLRAKDEEIQELEATTQAALKALAEIGFQP